MLFKILGVNMSKINKKINEQIQNILEIKFRDF
jgi:hypothetical protein